MTTAPTIDVPATSSSNNEDIQILDLAITLFARQFKPSLLNLDTLQVSGILPQDWELARQPIMNNSNVQLSFKNGVTLAAQGNSLICSQPLRPGVQPEVPGIARRYAEKMPHADYRGVGIGPKLLIGYGEGRQGEARNFIVQRLIAPGPWREIGQGSVQAKVDFAYQLDRCQMTLSIAEAQLNQPNQSARPCLLFASNFAYQLKGEGAELLPQVFQRLDHWPQDVQMFQDLIQQQFLGQVDSVFPA